MEQRYQAVLEVQSGVPVVDVAERFGVSRQAVHRWKTRYQSGGLEALADRSKRPRSSPWQVPAQGEALVCERRRAHSRWGRRRVGAGGGLWIQVVLAVLRNVDADGGCHDPPDTRKTGSRMEC